MVKKVLEMCLARQQGRRQKVNEVEVKEVEVKKVEIFQGWICGGPQAIANISEAQRM